MIPTPAEPGPNYRRFRVEELRQGVRFTLGAGRIDYTLLIGDFG
jgi:hypothetical protein